MNEQSINNCFFLLRKSLALVGALFIIAGLLLNHYFFETFVSYHGALQIATQKLILYFQVVLVIIGVFFIGAARVIKNSSQRFKNIALKLSLAILTIMLFLFCSEVIIRLISPQVLFSFAGTDPAVFQESAIIPWTLKPNASDHFVALDFDTMVSINSFGLRDKSRSLAKDAKTYRVLFLGDSFTYGFGVNNDETYPARLEEILNKNDKTKKFEVWNAGFAAGYTEDTYYVYLREKGLAFKPDMVVVGIFVENDILDFLKNNDVFDAQHRLIRITSDSYRVDKGKLRRGLRNETLTLFDQSRSYMTRFLLRYSRLYSYFDAKMTGLFQKENNPIFDAEYSQGVHQNFEKVGYFLSAIKKLTDEHGVQMAVILLPGKASVEELWQRYLKQNPRSDREKPRKIILGYCQKYKIACFDLWPYFINSSDAKKYYFEHDAHWSKEGNQHGAEILADWFTSQKIVPIR